MRSFYHASMKAFMLLLAFLCAISVQAQPVDNTISYQGRLDIGGAPANGQFDFEVVVFDALTGGNQVSPILMLDGVDVMEGLVNLSLDFGEGVFNGEQHFLELRVRDLAGGGGLVILEPRQPTLAAPYSISTNKVDGDVFQRGTIGNCDIAGSTGVNGSVVFNQKFETTPIVFLTADESLDQFGCTSARVSARSPSGFSYQAFHAVNGGSDFIACDCIHWLAIGKPQTN
ncbi:MAG: hypothetical protein Tsb002_02990 [Wenzhouxiangellaceae bacterium]